MPANYEILGAVDSASAQEVTKQAGGAIQSILSLFQKQPEAPAPTTPYYQRALG